MKFAAFIVLLGALVFFHELGHFLAAKYFNVKVLKFSLGFGPRLWGFKRGETEYQLAGLPLGGYVRMAGEDPSQPVAPEDQGRGFSEQKPYRRAIIAFAGPAVNLLLPPLVYFLLNLAPQAEIPAVVGVVLPGEPADRAGLLSGDRVLSVDGIQTLSFDQMREAIEARPGKSLDLAVDRHGERLTLHLTPTSEAEKNPIETLQKGKIGIVAGKLPSYVGVKPGSRADAAGLRTFDRVTNVNGQALLTGVELDKALAAAGDRDLTLEVVRATPVALKTAPVATAQTLTIRIPAGAAELGVDRPDLYLREVEEGSKAWEAGLRPGDRIVALAGTPVTSGPRFERMVEGKKALQLTVERGGQRVELAFAPPMIKRNDPIQGSIEIPDYGFAFHPRLFMSEPFADSEMVHVSYPPLKALTRAVDTTVSMTRGMVLAIAGLLTGHISSHSIGGPIMLFQLAGAASERGLAEFLKMFAVISINLGLMNLLPVPVLDGFHILVSGIEGISRRAVPLKVREFASYVGLAMLLALMLLAFKNDIVRTFMQ